jgi:rsbT co-antagonist protein RsbR
MLLEELEVTRGRSREQNREIERQAAQLAQQHIELVRALSIPIITVWPGVLALPIIGAVDADRASQMSEAMLTRVVSERATHVILDLTGAAAIQSETARSLLRMASAVSMLGSRCLLTGVSPEMARTLVELDFDTASVQTLPQLSDGLLRVLADKGQRLVSQSPQPAQRPPAR